MADITESVDTPSEPPGHRGASAVGGMVVVVACLALGSLAAVEARHVSVTHGNPLGWPDVIATTMPRWVVLALAFPFVLRFSLRYPAVPFRAPVWLVHAVGFGAISLTHAIVDSWSLGLSNPMVASMFPWEARVIRAWYTTAPTVLAIHTAIVATAWGFTEARERQRRTLRASQLEASLQTAQLAALRARLQPHFLYNTLHGIAALVADAERTRAVAAIEELAELLHASLRGDGREEVPVEDEVALAGRYLALQAMRFGSRLRYELTVEPAARGALVPILLLQPIVENAVVHGLDAGAPVVRVSVRAVTDRDRLHLTVENEASGAASAPRSGHGVGLAATRARLATAFGDAASLTMAVRPNGGAIVQIALPRRSAAAQPVARILAVAS